MSNRCHIMQCAKFPSYRLERLGDTKRRRKLSPTQRQKSICPKQKQKKTTPVRRAGNGRTYERPSLGKGRRGGRAGYRKAAKPTSDKDTISKDKPNKKFHLEWGNPLPYHGSREIVGHGWGREGSFAKRATRKLPIWGVAPNEAITKGRGRSERGEERDTGTELSGRRYATPRPRPYLYMEP